MARQCACVFILADYYLFSHGKGEDGGKRMFLDDTL